MSLSRPNGTRLGLAFAILMTFIIPPIYARLGSDHDKWPMFKPIWPDNTYFLAISKIPYQGDFDPKIAILSLKRTAFFRNCPINLGACLGPTPPETFFALNLRTQT
jgi:hypothetical protein